MPAGASLYSPDVRARGRFGVGQVRETEAGCVQAVARAGPERKVAVRARLAQANQPRTIAKRQNEQCEEHCNNLSR